MALVWENSALVNGDFATGDATGWTITSGGLRFGLTDSRFGSDIATGVPYAFGNSSSAYDEAMQSVAVPSDARAFRFAGHVGCNDGTGDGDYGHAWLRFFDSADNELDGALLATIPVSSASMPQYTQQGVVPAGADRAEVWIFSRRYAGGANNGCWAQLSLEWLAGEDSLGLTPEQLANGGFETGDLTGWGAHSGGGLEVVDSTTHPGLVSEGTYAARPVTGGSGAAAQQVPVPAGAVSVWANGWVNTELASDQDQAYAILQVLDASDAVLSEQRANGVYRGVFKSRTHLAVELPGAAAAARLVLGGTLRDGAATNASVDGFSLQFEVGPQSAYVSGSAQADTHLVGLSGATPFEVLGDVAGGASFLLEMEGVTGGTLVLALEDYGERWQPDTVYPVGARVRPSVGKDTGYLYEVTAEGDSGPTEPAWETSGSVAIGAATATPVVMRQPYVEGPVIPIGAVEDEDVKQIIQEIELTTAGEFDFDNIPQGYKRLIIEGHLRSTGAGTFDAVRMVLNGDDTPGNYRHHYSRSGDTVNAAGKGSTNEIALITAAGALTDAVSMLNSVLEGYAAVKIQQSLTTATGIDSSTVARMSRYLLHHSSSTAAITRIRIRTDNHPTDGLIGALTLYGEL